MMMKCTECDYQTHVLSVLRYHFINTHPTIEKPEELFPKEEKVDVK